MTTESDQQIVTQDIADVPAGSEVLHDFKNEKGKEKDDSNDKDKAKELEKGKEKETDRKGDAEKEKVKNPEGTNLDGLLQRLPGCVSRDLIDQLTVSNHTPHVKQKCPLKFTTRWCFVIFRQCLFAKMIPEKSR